MIFLTDLFIFYSGCCLGSALHVLAYWLPKGQYLRHPRSCCDHCRHRLPFWELFPLFSFLFLRGKCSHCHQKISPIHFWAELLMGFVLLGSFLTASRPEIFLYSAALFSLLFVMALCDCYYLMVPDRLQLLLLLLVLLSLLDSLDGQRMLAALGGFISLFLLTAGQAFIQQDGIGGADIKLLSILGLRFGLPEGMRGLFLSCLAALVYCVLYRSVRHRYPAKIPFVPFIATGFFLNSLFLALN